MTSWKRLDTNPAIGVGDNWPIVVILESRENARVAMSYATPSGGNRIEVCTRFV